jgi:hypothetical protein
MRDMATPQASTGYRGAGTWHEIQVTRDPEGRWQVIDTAGSQLTLVETLPGHDDRLSQAQALARDYADQQRAYHAGEREGNPLPRRPEGTNDESRPGPAGCAACCRCLKSMESPGSRVFQGL